MRGARSVNWLQDIFPEVAERLGIGSGRLARLCHATVRTARNFSLRRADRNIVLGRVMRRHVEGLGVASSQIVEIPNWADGSTVRPVAPAANALRTEWGLAEHFVVAHSGNLGRAHDFQQFLEAIALLEADAIHQPEPGGTTARQHVPGPLASVRWLFIGGGVNFAGLETAVADRQFKTVHFKPYQPRERLAESLATADVHLVTLRPELEGLIVPSKVYGCMAAGRPIIFVGAEDGEVAHLVRGNQCGQVVRPGDPRALANAIGELASTPDLATWMGHNARRTFERAYDIGHARNRWRQLIRQFDQSHAVARAGDEISAQAVELRPARAPRRTDVR
jgi:glycosyltransferase involved in cell wall biosynthesis